MWKMAVVIMIPKAGTTPNIPFASAIKATGKMFQERLNMQEVMPKHQFGFRENHSTIDKVHRIVNFIETAFHLSTINNEYTKKF